MTLRKLLLALLLAPLLSAPVRAEEGLVTFKSMNVDLALALARAALADCQKQGYQVTVAVGTVWAPAKRSRSRTCVTPKRSTTATVTW